MSSTMALTSSPSSVSSTLLRSLLQRVSLKDRRNLYIALTTPILGILTARYLAAFFIPYTSGTDTHHIYRAPARRLLTPEEEDAIPYPPDALPGGRDIDTPLGNVRAYEWGPENGRKVLFVHGISTPCIALARTAKLLVRKGCRVMLFDLYGRGYSDAPDPIAHRQDVALFSTQILAVLASSRLDWMGGKGITLVGYSLGGGIAAAFTSHYPGLVRSLVLIAPGGLLRPARVSPSSQLLYSGLLPQWLVNYWVGKRLGGGGAKQPKDFGRRRQGSRVDVTNAVEEEVAGDGGPHGNDSWSPIFEDRPRVSPATAVAWQVSVHPGFMPAFISSIKHAPIHDGHERWRMIGKRCEEGRESDDPETHARALDERKVLLIVGKTDVVILPDETANDATLALGKENIEVVKLVGGHDLPIMNSDGCAKAMLEFWDSSSA